jgi:hypothetical protein
VRLRWQRRFVQFLGWLIALMLWILKYPLGRKINPKADPYASIRGFRSDDLLPASALEPGATVQLLGYQASRNVVFTFAVLFTFGAVAWEVTKPWLQGFLTGRLWNLLNTVAHLFSNSLFAVCVVIVSLGVLEKMLPVAIWWSVNKLIAWRSRVFGKAMIKGLDALRHHTNVTS